ncbi:Superfamily II DNA or RNA helicase [Halogranum amylolyticum]|uniref:Superfamily II DNA or RNA helicase n=1 Tax=Halogranum amylolyticum TaxID=660520 RepID=A0A1H8W5S6_9EURY|nr:DEAD/DEAH box helicase family protein [Halogranum amylolyticum]SEP22959.1 Superfamily II DNA or RNA helicase [Halogranum amylolyticum]
MAESNGQSLTLASLNLERSYRTGSDPLNNFYIPCLSVATKYDRAAGFFDSKSLAIAGRGVAGLIQNGGQMRLLTSPRFSDDDLEALRAYTGDISDSDIFEAALQRGVGGNSPPEDIEKYLQTDRFRCLAWLLDEGKLEIRVAYMPDDKERDPFRLYHEKLGIIGDDDGNRVAFSGSLNETQAGWTKNYESFDVFRSWMSSEDVRIQDKQDAFDRLWNNDDPEVDVYPLPDAVKQSVTERSPETVDGLPALNLFLTEEGRQQLTAATSNDEDDGKDLWPHQQEAIDWWKAHNYHGLFAMATGTGKTYTALRAARLEADTRLTIIVVPTKVLVDQWLEDLSDVFGPDTAVLECTGREEWRSSILGIVDPYRIGDVSEIVKEDRTVLITTPHTASTDAFRRAIAHTPPQRLQIIIDEVHGIGSAQFRKTLEIDAGRRIGLSATPNRQWDEEGTRAIYEYFGGHEPFRLSTQEAIENGYLAEYEYHPLLCELSAEEFDEYLAYTNELGAVEAQLKASESPSDHLYRRRKQLLRERARIKKRAVQKPARFGQFLDSEHPTPAIVFCEDNEQIDELEDELKQRNKRYGVYVSDREDEQANAFHKFETGAIEYLLAIKCLDEGVDVPDCPTAVIISSSTNTREFIQRRGRVLRTSDSKDHAVIYDMFVLPGINAQPGDHTAQKIITQELRRAKLLMDAARNSDEAEVQLAEELESYGKGFKTLVYAIEPPDPFDPEKLDFAETT